ncbi:hypothetical protein TRFO_08328 [Tritrichomonas foetus]|uniref:aspartyl aminopeptidase n=1 Tax=Tritrichomonas foetus TaxID=1144522 RepID=A0A1J4JR04_9EUKA|nr:hypothetical protein TRFO_08328 [Tritrichomonas foetus]|eukprot:OHS99684.1 hypothetical protein TRFO_08328 [Tritrichomonas foetus]
MNEEHLINFLERCFCPDHFLMHAKELLTNSGYSELKIEDDWGEIPTKGFSIHQNGAIIAYKYDSLEKAFIISTHCDQHFIQISSNDVVLPNGYNQIKMNSYGDLKKHSFFQRPLKCVGYAFVRRNDILTQTSNKVEKVFFDTNDAIAFFPFPLELDNDGFGLNPIIGTLKSDDIFTYLSKLLKVDINDILDYKIQLVDQNKPKIFQNGLIGSTNLSYSIANYISLKTFLESEANGNINIFCSFFNNNSFDESIQSPEVSGKFLSTFLEKVIFIDFQDFINNSLCINIEAFNANETEINCLNFLEKNENEDLLINEINGKMNHKINKKETNKFMNGEVINKNTNIKTVNLGIPIVSKNSIREYCSMKMINEFENALAELQTTFLEYSLNKSIK